MNQAVLLRWVGIVAGLILLGLTGCASPPTRFYVLSRLSHLSSPAPPATTGGFLTRRP